MPSGFDFLITFGLVLLIVNGGIIVLVYSILVCPLA